MKISEAFDEYRNEFMYFNKQSQTMLSNNIYHKQSLISYLGDKDISDLTVSEVVEWCKWLSDGRCSNTVRNYVNSLRQVLKYARLKGYDCISEGMVPCPPRETTTVSYITPEEVKYMLKAADSLRNRLIISFLYASGVRLSEMLSLNRDSVVDRKFTVIGKGGKERICFIDRRTERLLNDYLESRYDFEPALFTGRQGGRLSCSAVQLMIRETAERAGIRKRIHPHTFRHGHATNLIANGADIRYVAHDLGHSSLNTTMIYTHIENPDMRAKYEQFHTI